MLEREFQYFQDHQKELVDQYRGKVVVIKDDDVIGVYDTDIEAYTETQKEHELGTFLMQRCTDGAESYTQTFHSRVAV